MPTVAYHPLLELVDRAWQDGDPARAYTELRAELGPYDVRPSRNEPGQYVICFADSRHAVASPRLRVNPFDAAGKQATRESYFATQAEAKAAIRAWLDTAEELRSVKGPKPIDAMKKPPVVRTLADEIKALRLAATKGPYHGWHPCSGVNCNCNTAPTPFRSPSAELLAMQAGKPAYGRK